MHAQKFHKFHKRKSLTQNEPHILWMSLGFTLAIISLFGWLVADGRCWFVMREEYCWLVAAGCWWLVRSERKVLLAGG
jgi:hypothetical protein